MMAKIWALPVICFLISAPAMAQILTIYSDQGISGDNFFPWSDFNGGTIDGSFTGETAPEGTKVSKTSHVSWAGWGVFYTVAQDFSAYTGGELRFWAKSTTGNVNVEVQQGNGVKKTKLLSSYGWSGNNWKLYRIPLADFGATLNSITSPFLITANVGATFFVDQVRLTSATVTSPWVDMKIKRRSDNVEVSSITWSNINLPTAWATADQYTELWVDPSTTTWGLQVYTDNKAADAVPQYSGTENPVGLVETALTARVLPTCWRTVDTTTTTLTIIEAPKPEDNTQHYLYSQELGSGFRCFQWMMDKQTSGFLNGSDAVDIWDNRGIHFAEGTNFGSANPPNYLYFGANFSNAKTPREYKTTTLRLELFSE